MFKKLRDRYAKYQFDKDKALRSKTIKLRAKNEIAGERAKMRSEYKKELAKSRANNPFTKTISKVGKLASKSLPKGKSVASNQLFAFEKPVKKNKSQDYLKW